jgi:hypothetical protein
MSIKAALAVLLAGFAFMYAWYAHGLNIVRDFELRNQSFVPATDMKILRAECSSRWSIITDCDVEYQPPAGTKQTLSYKFLGPRPEKSVTLLRSAQDRRIVIGDVGILHIWNRILCLGFFSAAMAAIAIFGVRKMADA